MMESAEIKKKFLEFFKARGHAVVPSSSLVPENDPTTLFTGSGMQPLVPYLLGERHPLGKRLVNSQKCFRAEDIDEVGDNRHTTFFEMLGNWSFGDYWKREQLSWFFEFLTREAGLKPKNLYVTVFAGDPETGIPADDESAEVWKGLFEEKGIEAKYVELGSEHNASMVGMQGGRIFSCDMKNNWWSRAGAPSNMPTGEPGGPDSEVFYDFDPSGKAHDPKFGAQCHPNCDCGRFAEIGNSVFMEYKKRKDGTFEKLAQRNVDFGGGLERLTTASRENPDIFLIDIFKGAMDALEVATGKKYEDHKKEFRVVLDHMRAAVFLLADGVKPSNVGKGYVLRRLLRRAIRFANALGAKDLTYGETRGYRLEKTLIVAVADALIDTYQRNSTFKLVEKANEIVPGVEKEEGQFRKTLARGLREFERLAANGSLSAGDVFQLITTYGFPLELVREEARAKGGVRLEESGLEELLRQHQDLSRTASAGMFKGGLADHSEKTTRLHTAHHLLLKALQRVLGPQVKQRGSNITSERLRMDFSYEGKMTTEQKNEVERIVNEKIAEDLPVIRSEMAKEKAEKLGAEHEFGQKYPDRVSVYSIGPQDATVQDPRFAEAFSIEFCGGPHVAHTGAIGHFRIAKEEAVGAGVRRIRGVVE